MYRLADLVRRMIDMFRTTDIKKAFGVEAATSDEMAEALACWCNMYSNNAPWLDEDVKSLGLPAAVASEMARLVTLELKSEITGSARASCLNDAYQKTLSDIRRQVEYGAAKGGLVFKPYVADNRLVVDYVQADSFFPTAFDASGRVTGAVFVDQLRKGSTYYTRMEYHDLSNGAYTIKNAAFQSMSAGQLGHQIPLDTVAEWADVEPELFIPHLDKPLFGYFKVPLANTIDQRSPLGVSVYARAVGLIEQADRQYSRLLWEFQSGERAVYADNTVFKPGKGGKPILPDKRLYRMMDLGDSAKLFEDYTPQLRDESMINGLNAILRKIEYSCGLAYGTLSDTQDVDKTAEEIRASKQRSYATVSDTQKALQTALEDLADAMNALADLYHLAPDGGYELSFEFDDSIVADRQAEFAEKQALVTLGIMQPYEFRAWYFGEDENEAKQKVLLGREPDFGGE